MVAAVAVATDVVTADAATAVATVATVAVTKRDTLNTQIYFWYKITVRSLESYYGFKDLYHLHT
jgi:hypothetical protein